MSLLNNGFKMSKRAGGSPVASSILSLWDFESAGRTSDETANSYDLTVSGSLTYATGKFGDAVSGFSSSNYFTDTNDAWPIGTNGRTFFGWFKTSSTSTDLSIIMSQGDNARGTLIALSVENGVFWIRTGLGRVASYGSGFNDDLWNAFAVVIPPSSDLSDVLVYANSVALTRTSLSSDGPLNTGGTANPCVGVSSLGGSPWSGALDQIGVAETAWTSDQVSYHYNSGAGRTASDLLTP